MNRLLTLAWKESRTARRRLALYMSSIALGVAALVAIDSFAGNVTRSIREQSRSLLGGDIALNARAGFPAATDSLIDSLAATGTRVARQTTFGSMARIEGTGGTRLAQVRAVTEGYPFYGDVLTSPADQWKRLHTGPIALVDESLLIALGGRVGDTLLLGSGRFELAGVLTSVPGDPGVAATIGPRIFISQRFLDDTQLLGFGARAEYEALLQVKPGITPGKFLIPLRKRLEEGRVRVRTVAENEANFTRAIDQLGEFLGIVGLVALLLGGVGVASGVHAFVARKIDTVAVLRCLGASSAQVMTIYGVQAGLMGLVGAAIGVAIGVAIQFALPQALGDFLPVDVVVSVEPTAIVTGLAVGVWVALLFALRPLIALRTVSPLQAIRRDADTTVLRLKWNDWPRILTDLLIVGSVVGLAILRTGDWREGLALSAGIAGVLVLLWLSATLLSFAARKLLRSGWPYVVRQGVANLYRPANQTKAVVLSLGFGAFLISTLFLVQANLLRQFDLGDGRSQGNMVFFDVQEDQGLGVDSLVRGRGARVLQLIPIVTMRILQINDWNMRQMTDTTNPDGVLREGWALRREYRSTYRDTIVKSEKLRTGRWFGGSPATGGVPHEVSLEADLMTGLGLELGDVITWDVQGVRVRTRVTSTREVNWARFEPNFFAVFSPGALEAAPKQYVLLTRAEGDARALATLQRDVVDRYPNVSSIDLTLIQRTIEGIVNKVSLAVRFLAIFSVAMGIPVLFTAVAATRRARVREGVLLKTLGATRRQIGRILLAEYLVLGTLGALTGMVLSFGGAWAILRFVFEIETFAFAFGPTLLIALAMLVVTVGIGLLGGRDVFRETPMAALREA